MKRMPLYVKHTNHQLPRNVVVVWRVLVPCRSSTHIAEAWSQHSSRLQAGHSSDHERVPHMSTQVLEKQFPAPPTQELHTQTALKIPQEEGVQIQYIANILHQGLVEAVISL